MNITEREREIIYLKSQGYTVRDIKNTLFMSPEKIQKMIKRIWQKMGAKNSNHMIRIAFDKGILERNTENLPLTQNNQG